MWVGIGLATAYWFGVYETVLFDVRVDRPVLLAGGALLGLSLLLGVAVYVTVRGERVRGQCFLVADGARQMAVILKRPGDWTEHAFPVALTSSLLGSFGSGWWVRSPRA
jgi:hypothetical protein